jgi:hypothetical protein
MLQARCKWVFVKLRYAKKYGATESKSTKKLGKKTSVKYIKTLSQALSIGEARVFCRMVVGTFFVMAVCKRETALTVIL